MINIFIFIISVVLLAVVASIFALKRKKIDHSQVAEILREFLRYAKKEKLNGLIVLEENDNLDKFIATGHKLEIKAKSLALNQIFDDNSEGNLGAVVIKNNIIVAQNAIIRGAGPNYFNPRQRIAVAVSRFYDALAIEFSHGQIWLFLEGERAQVTPERLYSILTFQSDKKVIKIN